jgi:hypothetical protein
MDLSTSYFATCTKAEVLLLEELAKEHRHKLRIKHIETPHSMQIIIETDSQQLRDYIYFMLQRLRNAQKNLEKVYNGAPGETVALETNDKPISAA